MGVYFYYDSGAYHFSCGHWAAHDALLTSTATDLNHIVGTWDGSTNRIYVNGIEGTSAAATAAVTNLTTSPQLASIFGITNEMNGFLGFVRVLKRTYSAQEALRQYLPQTRWDAYKASESRAWKAPAAPPAAGIEVLRRRIEGHA